MQSASKLITQIIKIDPINPDRDSIEKAADIIRGGGLVAFPTETVYGLGVNARDKKAIAKLCKVKQRPETKSFTIQIADKTKVEEFVKDISPLGYKFINQYWPGPLTLIFFSKDGGKIGIRIPDHPVTLGVIKASGVPLSVTSANISGNRPATRSDEVIASFDGKIEMILDAGDCPIGIESAVVDMTVAPFKVLREGALKIEQAEVNR